MNNQQVAHAWANQTKPRGRGSNFYFDGPALYSYGGHFCVGRIVENKKRRKAYILNSDTCSVSTSRHQSYARRAIASGATIFYVPGAAAYHEDNRRRFKSIIAARMAAIPGRRNARRIEEDFSAAREAANDYNSYSAFFTLRGRIKLPELATADRDRLQRYQRTEHDREAARAAEWEAGAPAREAAERARLAEAAKQDAERRQDFRDGKPRRSYIGGPCMLRFAQGSGNFETSQGADVPRADGLQMLRFLADQLRTYWRQLPRNYDGLGIMTGGFTLRTLTAEHVTIGCHVIPLSECALMASEFAIEWPTVPA